MPTPKKDGATKKKPVKKTGAPKKVTQKTPAKATKLKGVFFSGNQWSEILEKAFSGWLAIIGRYTLVVLITLGLHFAGVIALSSALFAVLGGLSGLENIMANFQVGTLPNINILLGSLCIVLLWFSYAVFITVISKIAFLSLIKDQIKGVKRSVLVLVFKEGTRFFGRYLGLALKVFFSVVWPLLLVAATFIGWDLMLYFYGETLQSNAVLTYWFPLALAILFVGAMVYLGWKGIQLLFAMPALIQTDKKITETFTLAQKITHKAWWFTALMWGLFVVILYALNLLLEGLAMYDPVTLVPAANPEDVLRLTDLLAFLISLFIFGPITSLFQYLLMLQTAKNQSVKL